MNNELCGVILSEAKDLLHSFPHNKARVKTDA